MISYNYCIVYNTQCSPKVQYSTCTIILKLENLVIDGKRSVHVYRVHRYTSGPELRLRASSSLVVQCSIYILTDHVLLQLASQKIH